MLLPLLLLLLLMLLNALGSASPTTQAGTHYNHL
jgi:hypothetical protein